MKRRKTYEYRKKFNWAWLFSLAPIIYVIASFVLEPTKVNRVILTSLLLVVSNLFLVIAYSRIKNTDRYQTYRGYRIFSFAYINIYFMLSYARIFAEGNVKAIIEVVSFIELFIGFIYVLWLLREFEKKKI